MKIINNASSRKLIGLGAIGLTLLFFFILNLGKEISINSWIGLIFILIPELLFTFTSTNKNVIAVSINMITIIVYFIIALLSNITFRYVLSTNWFLLVQLLLLFIVFIILTLSNRFGKVKLLDNKVVNTVAEKGSDLGSYVSKSVKSINTINTETKDGEKEKTTITKKVKEKAVEIFDDKKIDKSKANMEDFERRIYSLSTNPKNKAYEKTLTRIYEDIKYGDKLGETDFDRKINSKIDQLEDIINTEVEESVLTEIFEELRWMLKQRENELKYSKRGGY